MRKLTSFQFLTLNGFFSDATGNTSWSSQGDEQRDFALDKMEAEHILLFGRKTYEHMINWWPTEAARKADPEMAAGMNNAEKIVFSNKLKKAEWQNTRIVSGDIIEEVRRLKNTPGKNLALLGSGSILTQFAENHLIDELELMMNPIAIGDGHTLFGGLKKEIPLQLLSTKAFHNGVVLLKYIPAKLHYPEEGR
ncbi:dihydrofolate reductase [Chitinophaga dinghuensis]|uniref:Dihydrofolate reductase n=1 Tax=Chitinophaga dinghuensis TaxID=1539050 RepID=A0A327VR57_9BACT|nr:dihydrofolate reductase family protein [Chitinophaga dinghuensis]RAJ77523.1 dihydrofolate reductase [Chitinophaga dinghuensis]